MITEKDILNLKKEAEVGKQEFITAQATVAEVDRNIQSYNAELEAKGINPDNAEEELKAKQTEIMELYNKAVSLLPSK
jgi:uncharacterized coiled-coil DUF342 family protein